MRAIQRFPSRAFGSGGAVRHATALGATETPPKVTIDGLDVLFDEQVALMPLPPRQSPEVAEAQSRRLRGRRGAR